MTQALPIRVKISTKKTIKKPVRTLVHGEPGIGKSTFAAASPDAVFVCVEQGTNNIAVARAQIDDVYGQERDPQSFEDVCLVLDSLIAGLTQAKPGELPFKNLVLDTVDALEVMAHNQICRLANKKSIADFGFQKGYDLAVDSFRLVLTRLERIQSLGVGIVLLAHTDVKHFNNPEGQDFDYYDIKTHKKVTSQLIEWCDNVLFAKRDQHALEESGKVRGVGTGARFLYTTKTPAYVAKNRYDLPEKLSLRWSDYQNAMDAHQPGDPAELRKHAELLISRLGDADKKSAIDGLAKIGENDARTLTHFVDYCRSKLEIQNPSEQKIETK